MAFFSGTYLAIAGLCLGISLATTSRPRSVPLIALAALLWPITLVAIAVQAYFVTSSAKASSPRIRTS